MYLNRRKPLFGYASHFLNQRSVRELSQMFLAIYSESTASLEEAIMSHSIEFP